MPSKKLRLITFLVVLILVTVGVIVALSQLNQEQDSRAYGFQEKQLTNLKDYFSDTYSISNLQWSPAGDILAFQLNTSIWQIKRDGGELTELVENGILGSWSPDGTSLVYVTRSAGTDRIVLINRDDLSKKTIVSFTPSGGRDGLSSLDWNPKGEELAYLQSSYSQSQGWTEEIWKVDLKTMQKQLLLRDHKKKSRLQWSPDGVYLIFEGSSEDSKVEEDYGPLGELWILPLNSAAPKKLFGGADRIVTDFAMHPVANSAILLTYSPNEQVYSMWHVEFPEGNAKKLFQTSFPTSFSLSSEGKLFSIEDRIGESGSSLWILDVSQGSRSTAVSEKQNIEYKHPVWDPAGKAVALVANSQAGEEIFLLEK